MNTNTTSEHPCLSCGACCASFRVDFSVEETQECGGSVPDGLVVSVTDYTARMRGTDHASPRCAALTGTVGVKAACGASTNGDPRPAANSKPDRTPATACVCGAACRPSTGFEGCPID